MAWAFPSSDIFTTGWLNEVAGGSDLYQSVDTDPEVSPNNSDYCEAGSGASELSFGFTGLAEPASVIDVGLHAVCFDIGGGSYAGAGVGSVVLRDHAGRLIGSSGTHLDLWDGGAGGFVTLSLAVYEPNRGLWDLAGGPAHLSSVFLDNYFGSTYLAGFRLTALALEMAGSGTPGGGTGPGGQVGQNASILIPLMVQP